MRVVDVESGETDVFIRVNDKGKPVKAYEVQVSKRKSSAQLNSVKGVMENFVLKHCRK